MKGLIRNKMDAKQAPHAYPSTSCLELPMRPGSLCEPLPITGNHPPTAPAATWALDSAIECQICIGIDLDFLIVETREAVSGVWEG
jgi:hypothetical protein